MMGLLSTKCHF